MAGISVRLAGSCGSAFSSATPWLKVPVGTNATGCHTTAENGQRNHCQDKATPQDVTKTLDYCTSSKDGPMVLIDSPSISFDTLMSTRILGIRLKGPSRGANLNFYPKLHQESIRPTLIWLALSRN